MTIMNIANNKSELTLNCGIDRQFILHGAFESNELKRVSPISSNDFLSGNPAGLLGKMYRGQTTRCVLGCRTIVQGKYEG